MAGGWVPVPDHKRAIILELIPLIAHFSSNFTVLIQYNANAQMCMLLIEYHFAVIIYYKPPLE